jgi:hypothetical protein
MGSTSTAWDAVHRWFGEYARVPTDRQRDITAAHLDQLSREAWEAIENPGPVVSSGRIVKGADGLPIRDRRVVLDALRVLVSVDERRCRLFGLDAARKQTVQVISEDVLDAEIARLQAELAVREAQPPAPLAITTGGEEEDR